MWLWDTVQDIERNYRLNTKTKFKIINKTNIKGGSAVETVRHCRLFLREKETRSVFQSVCQAMETIFIQVSQITEYELKCELSVAEFIKACTSLSSAEAAVRI